MIPVTSQISCQQERLSENMRRYPRCRAIWAVSITPPSPLYKLVLAFEFGSSSNITIFLSTKKRSTVHKVALHPLIWDSPCLSASLPFRHNENKKKILLINARCGSANYQMTLKFEILSFKSVTRFLTGVEPYMQHQLSTPFQIYEEGMHVIN